MVVALATTTIAGNLAFVSFRKSVPPAPAPNPFYHQFPPSQTYEWGQPPQTPRHAVGYDGFGYGQQQIMPSGAPQRSPSKGQRSPSKGDRW